jgi:dipeptidyl aminopeptidase/acylaminoacyl peptidase
VVAPIPEPGKLPPRSLTTAQRGCLTGCLVVAALGAVGMIALGWWARESIRRDPQATVGMLFSTEPDTPVMAQPAGLARRLDVDLLMASDAAWSPDGRSVALCGVPGVSMSQFMPQQQVAPWDIPKMQREQQRRVLQAMSEHVFIVEAATGTSRTMPMPEEGSGVEAVAWWPDGRLLVFTQPAPPSTEAEPTDKWGPGRLWLVKLADGHAEKVTELKGYPEVAAGPRGVAFVMASGGQRQAYLLLPSPSGPALKSLGATIGTEFTWSQRGDLYAWGGGAKGQRWALQKVALPSGAATSVPVRELPNQSAVALSPDERLVAGYFPPGSKTLAFYALDPAAGVARRLSGALPKTAGGPLARLLGGRWILVQQDRKRNNQPVHRLYGYYIPEGRFYPVTDWGPLEVLAPRGLSSPAGGQLLLGKNLQLENMLRMFTGSFGSETWLLRLDERQLLSQAPTSVDEWTIKAGEACPTGG